MIKDNLTEENFDDVVISDSVSASNIFRDYINKNFGIEQDRVNIPELYQRLSKECKNVVNHTITCLLPEDRYALNLGGYLRELMNLRGFSEQLLINLLTVKRDCDCKNDIESDFYNRDDIKSRIQSFLKVMESQERSVELLQEIAALLSVDYDALTTGIGFEYVIDFDKLNDILEERNLDADKFVEQFFMEYVKCNHCTFNKGCEFKDNYFKYVDSLTYAKAESMCELLEIELEEILITKRICIDLEVYPFEKQYKRLLKAERRVIDQVIIDLQCFNNVQI